MEDLVAWAAKNQFWLANTVIILACITAAFVLWRMMSHTPMRRVNLSERDIEEITALAEREAQAANQRIEQAYYLPDGMRYRFRRDFMSLHKKTVSHLKQSDLRAAIETLIRISQVQSKLCDELLSLENASVDAGQSGFRTNLPESELLTKSYHDKLFRRITPTLDPLKKSYLEAR